MKKSSEVKFQSSANLFQFCRRVLDFKFGGIRVIDQDVGHILGFDPADCSHWKKGKKNIRSIQAMKSIAEHLGVDERLVVDVASGEIDDVEAYAEFNGYGAFTIEPKIVEAAKKDFYRKHAGTWTRDKELEFKAHFDTRTPEIESIVESILKTINFSEAPLYLPEVVAHYPEIKLIAQSLPDGEEASGVHTKEEGSSVEIYCPAGRETRPYMRFKIAKVMGRHFLKKHNITAPNDLEDFGQHLTDVQSNLFAARLLTPARLIRKEMSHLNVSRDIVSQLAEIFWVSKSFMNTRLKEILQETNGPATL